MIVETVTQAKANLSALLERVQRGEEVILCRAGKPVAVLTPYRGGRQPRVPGRLRGRIQIADDFDSLPPDLSEAFGIDEP